VSGVPRHEVGLTPGLAFAFAIIFGLLGGATWCRAADQPGIGACLVGIDLQQRGFDTMSAGDARPIARGEAGVHVTLDLMLKRRWSVGMSYHFGGTWLDWSDYIGNVAGKVEDISWGVRLGGDRHFLVGAGGTVFTGVGLEYGEAHSWVHSLLVHSPNQPQQDISDEGPRVFLTGGFARVALVSPSWRRIALRVEVSESFYNAHAVDPPFGTKYDWLGRSLSIGVGLRYEIARGRRED
jgi:hypothetical protein